ncbi:MAG: hypothetical protein GQ582_03225 [Methyloprofundus sp.]|nr:hypothetical protein [Methyloprofundus sp.]
MESSTGPNRPTTPRIHPNSNGLEGAVASAVNAELEKRGFNGGGGSGDDTDARLRSLETDMAIVKEAMVTKELFARETGEIKTEISKVPFETFKWLLATTVAITLLIVAVIKLLPTLETTGTTKETSSKNVQAVNTQKSNTLQSQNIKK